MTDIDTMVAFLALDREIAEEVMKWKPVQYPGGVYWDEGEQGPIPGGKMSPRFSGSFKPSTDWAAAGEVLEKLKSMGVSLAYCPENDEWDCSFTDTPRSEHLCDYAPTAELAICRAALRAVRARKESA